MELGAIVGVHWEVLAAQEMVPLFHGTLKEAIQVVNYIKRVFQKLCKLCTKEHLYNIKGK